MGIQFPRVISRRYNDRILHDDEEKSEMGKGYHEDIIFLLRIFFLFFFSLNLLSNVCYVCYRSLSNRKVIIDSRGIC